MSKEEVVAAIRECAEKLGRCPTIAELKTMRQIGLRTVRRYFGGYGQAAREAGFDPQGSGYRKSLEELFEDWAGIARKLGKLPGLLEYGEHSRHSVGPLITRFGGWTEVPRGLMEFARQKGIEGGWEDVLEMVEAHENRKKCAARSSSAANRKVNGGKAAALYGPPLTPAALVHAPTNEIGVVYLFGMLARELGYVVTRMQTEFPDCEAMREVEKGRWQRLRVEFEYESRNFLLHQHDASECDLIVCWVHNWPDCPESLEVLELSGALKSPAGCFDSSSVALLLRTRSL